MTENPHPLDPATADEYLAGRKIMADAGLLADPVRFAYYGLEEPPKAEVLGSAGQQGAADRRLRAFLLNLKNGESTDVVVSLTRGSVVSARAIDTAAEGQRRSSTPSTTWSRRSCTPTPAGRRRSRGAGSPT
jgi:primary-amine oxidase